MQQKRMKGEHCEEKKQKKPKEICSYCVKEATLPKRFVIESTDDLEVVITLKKPLCKDHEDINRIMKNHILICGCSCSECPKDQERRDLIISNLRSLESYNILRTPVSCSRCEFEGVMQKTIHLVRTDNFDIKIHLKRPLCLNHDDTNGIIEKHTIQTWNSSKQ